MNDIRIKNLSKMYKLYDKNKDRLKEAVNPFKRKYHREFYALNGINLEIGKGENLGIIGRNGSGKSTLLKIITGLLSPTAGTIEVNGKLSALLELGAGFNPDYTGIENIYLNGALMGFQREDMESRIDEIIDFASIGDFIHQPVKMYSSGMYIRLAFAVAINVDPDILIIDEALSVGDIRFQQKCYRKINEFQENNKTILFCTHDTGAVQNLCTSCIWIHNGQIFARGEPEDVVSRYHAYMYYDKNYSEVPSTDQTAKVENTVDTGITWQKTDQCSFFGEGGAAVTEVSFFHQQTRQPAVLLKGGEKVVLGLKVEAYEKVDMPIYGFNIKNNFGINAYGTNSYQENVKCQKLLKGNKEEVFFTFIFPPLANGDYSIDVALADGTQAVHIQQCWKHDVITFEVENIGDKYSFGYIYVKSSEITISKTPFL